jgi:hypothetical protein
MPEFSILDVVVFVYAVQLHSGQKRPNLKFKLGQDNFPVLSR